MYDIIGNKMMLHCMYCRAHIYNNTTIMHVYTARLTFKLVTLLQRHVWNQKAKSKAWGSLWYNSIFSWIKLHIDISAGHYV